MNILALGKEREDCLVDTKNNKLYWVSQEDFSFRMFRKLKEEHQIQVLWVLGPCPFRVKLFASYLGVALCEESSLEKEKVERSLQHAIAYKHRKEMPVLMYHRVISKKEDMGVYDTYVTVEQFEEQMKYLSEHGYRSMCFEDLAEGEYQSRFDKKWVVITFDDGYRDNLTNALPILQKYGMKAVLFLITEESFNRWDVETKNREQEKNFPLMNREELEEFYRSACIEIGGHTTKHLYMPQCSTEVLEEDLKRANESIFELTGKYPLSFAYPWGVHDERVRSIVEKLGYRFAVATEDGPACFSDDLFQIVRLGIYSDDDLEKFKEKIAGSYTFMRERRKEGKKRRNRLRQILGLKRK